MAINKQRYPIDKLKDECSDVKKLIEVIKHNPNEKTFNNKVSINLIFLPPFPD